MTKTATLLRQILTRIERIKSILGPDKSAAKKSAAKKSAKNSRNSRLKKSRNNSRKKNSYEVTSKSVAKKSNLSFDISAQMEELFEITKDDKNIEDEHFEKDKENFQVLGNLVRNQDSGFCQEKLSKIETSEKSKKCVPKNDFQILGNLVKNQDSGLSKNEKSSKIDTSEKSKNDFQVLGNLVKNQVSGSSKIENSEKSKKRVSWGDEEIQFSPYCEIFPSCHPKMPQNLLKSMSSSTQRLKNCGC